MEGIPTEYGGHVSGALSLNLRSRLPSTAYEDPNHMSGGLQMLSPKTPMMNPSFPELFQHHLDQDPAGMQTAMDALDSYANSASAIDLMPNIQRQISTSENSFDWNLNETKCLIDQRLLHPQDDSCAVVPVVGGVYHQQQPGIGLCHDMSFQEYTSPTSGVHSAEHVDTVGPLQQIPLTNTDAQESSDLIPTGDNNQKGPVQGFRRGNRQKTLSLNPDEREALETLIEDVIIEGVDMTDSDDSEEGSDEKEDKPEKVSVLSSPTEDQDEGVFAMKEETKTGKPVVKYTKPGEGKPAKPGESKVYPAQLKVAVKHMKNLPPRFLRKLQVANKDGDGDKKDPKVKGNPETKSPEKEKEDAEVTDPILIANQARVEIKGKAKEDAKMEAKKQIRDLLVGYDQYASLEDSPSAENSENTHHPLEGVVTPEAEQLSPRNSLPETVQNDLHSLQALREALPETVTITSSLSPDQNLTQTDANLAYISHRDGSQQMYDAPQHGNIHPLNRAPLPPMLLTANAVNCDDLERELLKGSDSGNSNTSGYTPPPNIQRMSNVSSQRAEHTLQELMGMGSAEKKPMQFSVDAPEFVPRSYTPSGVGQQGIFPPEYEMSPPVSVMPPPTSSPFQSLMGQVSPHVSSTMSPAVQQLGTEQLVASFGRSSPVTGTQSFMIPKMPTNAPPPPHPTVPPPPPGVLPTYRYPVPSGPFAPSFQPQYPMPAPFLQQAGYTPWATHDNKVPPQNIQKHIPPPYGFSQKPSHHMHSGNSPKLRERHMHQMMNSRPNSAPNSTSPHLVRHAHNHQPASHQPPPAHVQSPAPSHVAQMGPPPRSANHSSMMPACMGRALSPRVANQLVGSLMQEGKRVMVILRGCPGSGKSTLAQEMQYENGITLNTDEFFVNNGEYHFDPAQLGEAHDWNHKRAHDAVLAGKNPVVIDNTNIQAWEMKYYVSLALTHQYHIEIIEPDTTWKNNPIELAHFLS